ncbi:hypothetical protein V6L77_17790 [Pannonibacter sp. Pt2-lr]
MSSLVCFDGPHILTIVHQMKNAVTGDVLATAIDGYTPPAGTARTFRSKFKDVVQAMPEEAAPRALPASPLANKATLESIVEGAGSVVYRGTVLPRHLGADNKADDGFIAQCIGEALPHVWQQTPLNLDWQQETGRGRQLFEMKLTWISPLKAGESFVIAVSLTGTQANMLGARFSCLKAAPAAFAPSPIPLWPRLPGKRPASWPAIGNPGSPVTLAGRLTSGEDLHRQIRLCRCGMHIKSRLLPGFSLQIPHQTEEPAHGLLGKREHFVELLFVLCDSSGPGRVLLRGLLPMGGPVERCLNRRCLHRP